MMYALKRWVVGFGLAATVLPAVAPRAEARAFTYSTKIQTIRVGVLLANDFAWARGNNANSSFSYVFQALNARTDIRPYGWEILNPNAPPFMDEGMARRWGVTFDLNNPPKMNKNMAAYWEVFLHEVTPEQLADYDVLYMPYPLNDGNGDQELTVQDREKLRRAVDGGTVLWIDNASGAAIASPVSGGKLFVTPGFRRLPGANQYADPMDALVNTPFKLTGREARQIGFGPKRSSITEAMVDNRLDVLQAWKPVLFSSASTVTAGVFSYGQGAIVLTGGAIGEKITRGFRRVGGESGWAPNNSGPISGSDSRFISVADLKFLVNIIAYRFQSPQPGAGPRHSSGSRQDLDTPLGRKWQDRVAPAFEPISDPAVWNGIVFAVSAEGPGGFLRAYDMDPERDLDGDGNPDDGRPDPSGRSADIIWQVPLGRVPVSSLVVGTINGDPVVYGMRQTGELFAVQAMNIGNVNGRRRLLPTANIQTLKVFDEFPDIHDKFYRRAGATGASRPTVPDEGTIYRIPAPVWYNGRLFVVGIQEDPAPNTGIGGIAEINPNPRNLSIRWEFPGGSITPGSALPPQSRMGVPSATPTVAAVPDKGYSDATDIMLLVPTISVLAGDLNSGGVNQPSRVMAFPLGVRGERVLLSPLEVEGQRVFLTRFANANAIRVDDSTVRLWAPDGSSAQGVSGIDRSRGYSRLYMATNTIPTTDDIRADYDFLPGEPANNFQGYNARWSFDAWSYVLGTNTRFMEILTSPVVSNDGGIYFVASDVGYGGNQAPIVMGLEMRQQRIAFNLENNPTYLAPLNQPQLTFLYNVGSVSSGLATDSPTPQPVVMGTPAVDRGILYAAWGQWSQGRTFQNGNSGPALGTGGVSGFLVRNTRFGLLLQYPVDEKQKTSISVVQRNRYTGDFQQVGYGLFDVENISVGNALRGLLVFRSLSAGPGAASLDLSRPGDIQVSYQGLDLATGATAGVTAETPTVYYRTARGEGSEPSILRAFSDRRVPQGRGGIRTGVTMAGGSIYVGSDDGTIWTVPLPTELERLQNAPAEFMQPATFPSLARAAGPGSHAAVILRSNPVVAANALVQQASAGVFTFDSPRTLITESDRVLEVVSTYRTDYTVASSPGGVTTGSGSAAVWSLNSTTQTRDYGRPGAGPGFEPWGDSDLDVPVTRALEQPTMAIRVNTTNTLICDTGNNRVVEVDRTGRVVWHAVEFADPYGLLGPNESRTLQSPTSVQRWESFEYEDDVPARSVHTLIADSGNNRVLELVTRYSPSPERLMNNVLVWVGRGPAGTAYQFYQAHRLPYFPANANDPDFGNLDLGRTVASVTNVMVNSADAPMVEFPGTMTNRPATAGGSIVLLGGPRDGVPTGAASGRVVYFINTMMYGSNPTVFPLARPVFFQTSVFGPGPLEWGVMLTDGQNIFEMMPDSTTPGLGNIAIDPAVGVFPIVANQGLGQIRNGAIGSGGYTVGVSMSRRLSNGNILIVNQQTGQVFEFAAPLVTSNPPPSELLQFLAPPLEGTTALSRPVYADRIF